jgi:hypothetical protein
MRHVHYLVITDMDQIVSISRRLLDVRRPFKKPTSEEMEEFLLMYDPLIMVDPKTIITGDHPVSVQHIQMLRSHDQGKGRQIK